MELYVELPQLATRFEIDAGEQTMGPRQPGFAAVDERSGPRRIAVVEHARRGVTLGPDFFASLSRQQAERVRRIG
jgi:hypothetical protein